MTTTTTTTTTTTSEIKEEHTVHKTKCPKCNVSPNKVHKNGCDVERCASCGDQRFFCRTRCTTTGEDAKARPRLPWTGEWPGVQEAHEYGLYAKRSPTTGWVPCLATDPEATPDLNTLMMKTKWNPVTKVYELLPTATT